MTILPMLRAAKNRSSVRSIIVRPQRGRKIFGVVAPILRPSPAATIIAVAFIINENKKAEGLFLSALSKTI
jgi:hypothetical protein